MSSSYAQRVAGNILPLSVVQTLPEAFREWYFTEHTIDHERPTETCELCEQEELRYHFEIQNRHTGKCLMVGSQCILRFELAVFDDGRLLEASEARRKLEALTRKMQHDSCLKALQSVALTERNEILQKALEFYQKNDYLTPKQGFVVLWRLQKNRIEHHPSFFKISLNKERYRDDLREMALSRVHLIWPALTSGQRKIAERLGHPPPGGGVQPSRMR